MKQKKVTEQRAPLWHEYASDGILLAHGQTQYANNLLYMTLHNSKKMQSSVTSSTSPSSNTSQTGAHTTVVRCLGTDGKFVDLDYFGSKSLCKYCNARMGMRPAWFEHDSIYNRTDMCDKPTDIYNKVIVPYDCPHADEQERLSDFRSYAKCINIPSKNDSPYTYVHSWKIVSDGKGKITLSIQYRTYAGTNTRRIKTETLYRHITLNLKNGQTFVSNIHNENKTHPSHMELPAIDNITYTGTSVLIFAHKVAVADENSELLEPLKALYEILRTELSYMGYEVKEPVNIPTSAWKTTELRTDVLYEAREILKRIVCLNRFPQLGCFPLSDIALPLQVKRDISQLPRDVIAEEVGAYLGFSDAIAAKVARNPQKIGLLMSVMASGCNEEDALLVLLDDYVYEAVLTGIINCKKSSDSYNVHDVMSMVLPSMLTGKGWKSLFVSIGDNYSEFMDAMSGAYILLRKTQFVVPYEHYGMYQSLQNENVNESYARYAEILAPLPGKFKKNSIKWDMRRNPRAPYSGPDFSMERYELYTDADNDHHMGSIETSVTYSMDRRIWNRQSARDYAQASAEYKHAKKNKQELESALRDRQDEDARDDDENALHKATTRFDAACEKLEKYFDKMSRALSANPKRTINMHSNQHDLFMLDYDSIQAVLKWAEKNKVELVGYARLGRRYWSKNTKKALKNMRRRRRYAINAKETKCKAKGKEDDAQTEEDV